MISKNSVKYIQSLQAKKKRTDTGLFVAEGPKVVQELLDNGFEPELLYATQQWQGVHASKTIVTNEELARLSALPAPNQAIAVFKQKQLTHQPVFSNTITLVLDGIQDPGNMGTIMRTADWFGITQIVASHDTVDIYNSKVVQSTMGSLGRVNVFYANITETLKTASVTVYGALLNGKSLYVFDKMKEGMLIIGNEANGIREENIVYIKEAVTIPRIGATESLNAAVATGIILSHLVS